MSIDALEATYTRESTDSRVLVVDGYGVYIHVQDGQLIIRDGICENKRARVLARVRSGVKRIIVIAQSGSISLDALQWLREVKRNSEHAPPDVSLTVLRTDGELLATSAMSGWDAGLRRAQVLSWGSRPMIAWLLDRKFDGRSFLADRSRWTNALTRCKTIKDFMAVEANEAAEFFGLWGLADTPFEQPLHWSQFISRTSPRASSPRNACDPVNAALNYAYGVALGECAIACHVAGFDPSLGFYHSDTDYRWSMACDVIETVRPVVDQFVWNLIPSLRGNDFAEQPNGVVRVLPPMTHRIAEQALLWYQIARGTCASIRDQTKEVTSG